jgi:hypothetical protein
MNIIVRILEGNELVLANRALLNSYPWIAIRCELSPRGASTRLLPLASQAVFGRVCSPHTLV